MATVLGFTQASEGVVMDWVILIAVVAFGLFGLYGRSGILTACQYISDRQPTFIALLNALAHRLDRIEAKLDKIIETLPRYDEIADLESQESWTAIPEIEGPEDKDE